MAKKNTVKQARLDARAAQIQAQVAADRRRTRVIIAVFAVVVVGGAGLLYLFTNPPAFLGGSGNGGGTATSIGVVNGVGVGKSTGAPQAVPNEARNHVARGGPRVNYKHQPPTSGDHYSDQAAPRPWGAVQSELLPEEFVHNLEHGGIVMVYRCTGGECPAAYSAAQALFASLPKDAQFGEVKFLSTPYQALVPHVALLAWDHEQDFNGIPTNADALSFYKQFVGKGPEAVP